MSLMTHDRGYYSPGFHVGALTPAVTVLLILNVGLFLVQLFVDRQAEGSFTLLFGLGADVARTGFIWQFVTYMFLHGGVFHLFINMLILFFLGPEVERTVGTRHFLGLYFISGIIGGLGWFAISDHGLCIGASAAIFGVLGAFATLFPHREITLLLFLVLPVTMKAWVLAAILTGVSLLYVIGHFEDGIAHSAHLAGVVSGFVYAYTVFRGGGIKFRISRSPRNKPGLKVLRREDALSVDQGEVDRILDKIANKGMGSLTRRERDVLDRASRNRRGRG